MDIAEQIRDIKKHLRLSMNGVVSQSMREKGLVYKLNFGVELPRIKSIAALYEPHHDLAQALWKQDIRECKILAAMLQPADTFCPELADIWVDSLPNTEMAEMTSLYLFSRLPYAPALSFRWIADDREYAQVCGYLIIARLLLQRGEMEERVENEFLDQAIASFLSGSYAVRQAAATALRRYLQQGEAQAFAVCRRVESYRQSANEVEQQLYALVQEEAG